MNTQRYFNQLINTGEQLISVLHAESSSVRDREIEKIRHLQDEKRRLAFEYEQKVKVLDTNPDLIDKADAQQRARLNELGYDFVEAAKENLKVLKAAHESGARVLKVIRHAVEEAQNPIHSYTGAGAQSKRTTATSTVSLSIDETL